MPKKWYQSNRRLFNEERKSLACKQPFLKLEITAPGTPINNKVSLKTEAALVSGIYRLLVPDSQRYHDYRIAIIFPNNYPNKVPVMYCNDEKLPIGDIDRHIMKDGYACLGVKTEVSQRWLSHPSFENFLDDLVAHFLAWQVYYDTHGYPPPWGQRAHFAQGILEFYAEILDIPVGPHVKAYMKLLARKNHPKGHEECPCGSGKRLRYCHSELIRKSRERLDWQNVLDDISIIEQGADKSGNSHISVTN